MQKATAFSQAINKRFRGGTDVLRGAFVVARHLQHPARFLAARRVAQAMRPAPAFAIDPDQGFRLFPDASVPEAAEVVAACTALLDLAKEKMARGGRKGRKRFLVNLLDQTLLNAQHPLVRLAVRPDLLEAISAYMGTVPVLRSIQVFYSGALKRELASSQLYHCDADDWRQVKIFVLCSDVQQENGPLTVLDAARSARVRRATGYQYHSRLSDEQVEAIIGVDPPTAMTGAPGTVCLVDTSRCFHYGSRVRRGAAPRLVAMIQFLNPAAFVLPGDYRSGALLPTLALDRLTPLQRAVVSGDHAHLQRIGRDHG